RGPRGPEDRGRRGRLRGRAAGPGVALNALGEGRHPTAGPAATRRAEAVPGLDALRDRLAWRYVDDDDELLARALAHRSWCAETPGTVSNERLEFLGDAVLGLVVTHHVFQTYPDLP